ncbi:MAG: DNA-binding response regulator [Burkholderiales bacterium PBB3]|nr:MAG: DNA-binding response regulator [Burkholderiales bacterium PBB3]
MTACTALIADDEPLLREQLALHLKRLWPELEVVARARNGREAVELFDQLQPDVCFLDVHMPGMNGVEAARSIGRRASIVFVTAYENYAVEAFRQGAIDYLVKPLEEARLQDTIDRLRTRLKERFAATTASRPAPLDEAAPSDMDALLDRMALQLRDRLGPQPWLKWIKASVGSTVRLIPVEQVLYLKSDTKYTLVAWEGGEALIRKTIRELADTLDPQCFAQIHRSVIVNLQQVAHFAHSNGDSGEVQLKGRSETLAVSRSYVHLFRQM